MSTISSGDKPSFSGAIIPLPVVLILVDVVVRIVDELVWEFVAVVSEVLGNVVEIMELDFVDISEGVVFDIVDVTVAIVVILVLTAIKNINRVFND